MMNIQIELEKFLSSGITPILTINDAQYNYDGETDEKYSDKHIKFMDVLAMLGTKMVLIETYEFSSKDFFAQFNDVSDLSEDDYSDHSDEDKDLTKQNPEINEYKQYWGEISCIKITFKTDFGNISHEIPENWFIEFKALRLKVIQQCESTYRSKLNEIEGQEAAKEIEEEKRRELLIAQMWQLVKNKSFCRIPTQKAQIDFAISNISGLEEIDYSQLKSEMQKIKARIVARGYDKK